MLAHPSPVRLGQTDLTASAIGVGTWSWGDHQLWGYGTTFGEGEVTDAFRSSIAAGITLFDTAEFYGFGKSEQLLGKMLRQHRETTTTPIVVASKFLPYPWRLTASTAHRAIAASRARLGVQAIDLYQVHLPWSLITTTRLMNAFADAVAAGTIRSIGVSNYGAAQMRRAHAALARRGIPLAANQVEYSLLQRRPERNGVLAACRELGVTLIAYSPLGQGRLTGKYSPEMRPADFRSALPSFQKERLRRAAPVIGLLREIGAAHGKEPAQVALNWLIGQPGVIAIPGAKNGEQARTNAGALGWSLTDDERSALTSAAP